MTHNFKFYLTLKKVCLKNVDVNVYSTFSHPGQVTCTLAMVLDYHGVEALGHRVWGG